MKLIDIYQNQVRAGKIKADEQQFKALEHLQIVFNHLVYRQQRDQHWWYKLLKRFGVANGKQIKGVYCWGSVGIGKTFLMDIFYNALPLTRKIRMHFHVFMRQVHHNLQRLQGHADPLKLVARHFALHADVLCFDEFFVNDITDAMLLGRLFTALFERGVTLVTTSNQAPDDLYKDGLQRKLFLPTIELIKQACDIVALNSINDYRLRTLTQAGVYFYPLDHLAQQQLQNCFELYVHGAGEIAMPLVIETRPIPTVMLAKQVVWFEFSVICNIPRSQFDYIAIAKRFATVLISNVPQIAAEQEDTISYFINLVDVFYDQQVQLLLSAAVPAAKIYPAGSKYPEFQRTLSRLIEMQSLEYLEKCHNRLS